LAAHYPAGNILIGRDTRPSGPGLSAALAAGIRSGGATPINLGVIPTPGLAAVVAADAEVACGVVVTASHNPAEYNGLKVIGRDGRKVPDALERELERMIDERLAAASAESGPPERTSSAISSIALISPSPVGACSGKRRCPLFSHRTRGSRGSALQQCDDRPQGCAAA